MNTNSDPEEFLRDYCASFVPGNMEIVAAYYRLPVTMIFGENIQVLDTRDKVLKALNAVMDGLVEKGFDHTEVDEYHCHRLNDTTSILSAAFSRLKTDGSLLEKLGASYTVVNDGAGYKISYLIAHRPDRIMRFQN